MIDFHLTPSQALEEKLKEKENITAVILKKAINEAAAETRQHLIGTAVETYALKKSSDLKKSTKIDKAKNNRPCAVIQIKSKINEILDFKALPRSYNPSRKSKKAVQAKVLRKNKMKPLEEGNLKAFLVKFKNGHVSVVQRVEKGKYPKRSRLKDRYVKKMLSPSETILFKQVYLKEEQKLKEILISHVKEIIGDL